MLIYELLTYCIILLGKLRHWYLKKFYWKTGFYVRYDRDKINIIKDHNLRRAGFLLECCDCGLVHSMFLDEKDRLHCIPQRPKEYKYLLRRS